QPVLSRCIRLTSLYAQGCAVTKIVSNAEQPTYNEVRIQMLSRHLQACLFGCEISRYDLAPQSVLNELEKHGIDVNRSQPERLPVSFSPPDLIGGDIEKHMQNISAQLVTPYRKLLDSFSGTVPPMPESWSTQSGWTRYSGDQIESVRAPVDDIMVLDIEVLMEEGDLPTMAVVLTPNGCEKLSTNETLDSLIPLYDSKDTSRPKCVIGHFVSFDRARLLEEYYLQGTGTRFLDTLSFHVAVSGLTSTQRHLKTAASKHLFNNKLWQKYMSTHGETSKLNDVEEHANVMGLQWISETSLNNLTDVYRLYCAKEPPQDKTARSVFECGTRQEVQTRFQELMRYCATDVSMTYEVFQKLLPLFKERFPHPATLYGMLEMGSMYLPINDSWSKFQENADRKFAENEQRQKQLLMQLADQALQHYSSPDADGINIKSRVVYIWQPTAVTEILRKPAHGVTGASRCELINRASCVCFQERSTEQIEHGDAAVTDYAGNDDEYHSESNHIFAHCLHNISCCPLRWYRELIPKPIKENLDAGPALLTAQMRIAPKLLRLCWQGLPLHYDQELKWGVLIPGRAPQPYGDPRFYEETSVNCNVQANSPSVSDGENTKQNQDRTIVSESVNNFCNMTLRSRIPVSKETAAGRVEYSFPYGAYLSYWSAAMQRRFLSDLSDNPNGDFASAYRQRAVPDSRDDHLMDELQRSIQAMPLEPEERARLFATISAIRNLGTRSDDYGPNRQGSSEPVYEYIGEMQIRGPAFWLDPKRYECVKQAVPNKNPKSNRRQKNRRAVDTVNPVIPTCWFNHLPHDDGEGLPVGSPLSRSFQTHIAANRLHSASMEMLNLARANAQETPNSPSEIQTAHLATELLRDRVHATFWQSYSKRIRNQMAVWLPTSILPTEARNDPNFNPSGHHGAILPQVIVAGTVSRRAVEPLWLTASNADRNRLGSEIKAMVQAPPGYCFVGADVDSQEMWIAALIGDASFGFQGKSFHSPLQLTSVANPKNSATPYGWMTLEGNKTDGTDLHTKIAQIMGITRNEAKVLNYARLYGSGHEFTKHLLTKFSNLTPEQAGLKANQLLRTTKGQRTGSHSRAWKKPGQDSTEQANNASEPSARWQGGSESAVFNELESIARSSEPCTPVLKARMTRALNPKLVKEDFLPSRINWVVQSSAVDYLHCMLLVMGWLIQKYSLPARLCISIHDEVRYLCRQDAADRVALALQISNLFTRAFFAYQLGMRDLPESVAFFSSVEIDTCLRKNPDDDCITPSNPDGLQKTYGIPSGQSLTIHEILQRTGGSLEHP
ncbi:DNA-directed DNA polymerase, partial [Opisthorchis viverrini]